MSEKKEKSHSFKLLDLGDLPPEERSRIFADAEKSVLEAEERMTRRRHSRDRKETGQE